ncbi:MAG: DUF115 domain-containing protein [Zavarzinia sp.]|nr:DUF115 domain-containing protein [Zavarzinia sp.]
MSARADAFIERFPALAAVAPSRSRIVRDEAGVAIDVDLGQGLLYGGDGPRYVAEQLARFDERPLRFFTADLSGANIGSPVSSRLRDSLLERMGELDITTLSNKPEYDGTFLVILGIGLGLHLEPLFETTKARTIMLCEPIAEFIALAREEVDWPKLFAIAERRGIDLRFSAAATPEGIIDHVKKLIAEVGEPMIDGAYVFVHYPSWALTEARDRLQQVVDQVFISKGFYEDELLMMTNAVANLQRHDFRLIDGKPKLARRETALVIGSGPSIDRSMEDLKRLAPQGVVFSAGTSLRVCLRNGIRPDFHSELENGPLTFEVLQNLSREFDLSGITLIASLTVDPRVPTLFDKTLFFFRDSVSSTKILAPERHELRGVAPTCVNTAARVAAALGFTEFLLFGTDCGTKIGGTKHSKDTIYGTEESFKAVDRRINYNQTLPGNFGGEVACDWILALCARMLGEVASVFRLNMFNTSDGVRLDGTKPRLSKTIKALVPAADRAIVARDVDRITTPYAAGQFLSIWPKGLLTREATAYYDDLLALVDAAVAEGDDLVAFWRRLAPFMRESEGRYAATYSIAIGSIRSMPKIGMYFVHRVTDAEKRAKMVQFFFQAYRETVVFMRDGTLELLTRLEDGIENAAVAAGGEA